MGWRHRYIQSKSVYEICFRAREGIPLPCREEINFLVECALAWALRDSPVKVCSIVVMGNHIHLLVVVYDPNKAVKFYGELMKRLTDSIKRYTEKKHLRIWESRAMVALVADPKACIERIKYFYLNPARANLVKSIDVYPGVSSWEAFKDSNPDSKTVVEKLLPKIHLTEISRPSIHSLMSKKPQNGFYKLKIHPFAWIEAYPEYSLEPEKIRFEIIDEIKSTEEFFANKRAKEKIVLRTIKELKTQRVLSPFTPQKYERKVFVLSSDKDLRISLIDKILTLSEKCKKLYQLWKQGIEPLDWPSGMFKPRTPHYVCAIS